MTQEQILMKIAKIYILADIIEAEIVSINPIRNVGDSNMMMRLETLQKECVRFRKKLETNHDFNISIGELSDFIDEKIDEVLV